MPPARLPLLKLSSSASMIATVPVLALLAVLVSPGVAVVPLTGFLVQKPNVYTRYGWMTSTEQFCAVNELLASDAYGEKACRRHRSRI